MGRCGRSNLPVRGREAKEERGTTPFPVRERDRGGNSFLPIWERIKVGEGKRGLGVFP